MQDEVGVRATMLANRLRKVARHRRKWARRQRITCYRLYDHDIPEVPLAIDWYEAESGLGHVYVAERLRTEEAELLPGLIAAISDALGVPSERVFVKQRQRQRGAQQYTRLAESNHTLIVREGGLRFQINLSDYLDTGLFLDHRETRALVAAEAADRDVLNLFAYTGSFTIYAAAAGARTTTTIDLSNTYVDWTARNLILNDLTGPTHALIRTDVFGWLEEARASNTRYDLAVLDPPTFSNSKRMDRSFDIQRDHVELIRDTLDLLRPGGALWFSTNARRFKLDPRLTHHAELEEMTSRTVPADFERRRPHRSWRMVSR